MDDVLKKYWEEIARHYYRLGPPFLPSASDVTMMENMLAKHCPQQGYKILLLGVTPALANMKLPNNSTLLAVEQSQGMIGAVWPGDIPNQRIAKCQNWLELGQAEKSYDIVIGDGSFNCISYQDVPRLVSILHNLLKKDGVILARFYTQSANQELPQDVLSALWQRRFSSFHAFKMCFLMSLQQIDGNVKLDEVWRYWANANVDVSLLQQQTGWDKDSIETIGFYQNKKHSYCFPTLQEVKAIFSEKFQHIDTQILQYELGERCPILGFRSYS